MSPNILLLGATGYTGQLVAQELLKRNIKFQCSGSNLEKLESFSQIWSVPYFAMDLKSDSDLKKIPEEIKYILNCAGPFALYAPRLLASISSKKMVYLDVCGEQSFVFSSYLTNQDSKSTIIHACAFESFIADALAAHLKIKDDDLEDLSSFYYFASPKVSPGTRLSMQLVRHFQTYKLENLQWLARAPGDYRLDIHFKELDPNISKAVFAPYPEILFFSKTHKTLSAGSYILAKNDDWVGVGGTDDKKSIDEILLKHQTVNRPGPDESDRKKGKFMVGIRALYKDKSEKRSQVFGVDTYKITAAIMVRTLEELMSKNKIPNGVFAPSELVDSFKILESLTTEFELSFV